MPDKPTLAHQYPGDYLKGFEDFVLGKLIGDGRLPVDTLFRLNALVEGTEQKQRLLQQVVSDAIDGDAEVLPTFLTQPLPDCILFNWFTSIQQELMSIDEDYYRLGDLSSAVNHYVSDRKKKERNNAFARQVWRILIERLGPMQAHYIRNAKSPERAMLARVVIRDEPLKNFYDTNAAKKSVKGLGNVAFSAIRVMLADNHPELLESEV